MTDQLTVSSPELLDASWLLERRERRMATSLHSHLHHVLQLQQLSGGNMNLKSVCIRDSGEQSKMITVYMIFLGMSPRKMADAWNANGNEWRAWSYRTDDLRPFEWSHVQSVY